MVSGAIAACYSDGRLPLRTGTAKFTISFLQQLAAVMSILFSSRGQRMPQLALQLLRPAVVSSLKDAQRGSCLRKNGRN